jgi:hypothetical protein
LSYSKRHSNIAEMKALAARAVTLALSSNLGEGHECHEIRGRARAYLANAHRCAGDIRAARLEMASAKLELDRAGQQADPTRALAEELSIWIHEGAEDWTAALTAARSAMRRREQLCDTAGQGKVALSTGIVLRYAGEPAGALPFLRFALNRVDGPVLVLAALHATVSALSDTGDSRRAVEILAALSAREDLIESGGPRAAIQLDWLRGRVLAGLEAYSAARAHMEQAREGLSVIGDFKNAALASLDLAAIETLAGRPIVARRVTIEAQTLLVNSGVCRTGLALAILRAASERADKGTGLLAALAVEARRLIRRA